MRDSGDGYTSSRRPDSRSGVGACISCCAATDSGSITRRCTGSTARNGSSSSRAGTDAAGRQRCEHLAPWSLDRTSAGPWTSCTTCSPMAPRSACSRSVIQCDNGSEFTSTTLDHWAYWNRVQLDFSRPGKPVDNCICEAFNSSVRRECLTLHWFVSMAEANHVLSRWRTTTTRDPI